MTVIVAMALTAGGDAQPLIHGYKAQEANHDRYAEQEVLVRAHENEACTVWLCFAEKDFGKEVKEGIAEEATDCEGDHDGEGAGVDVWWA